MSHIKKWKVYEEESNNNYEKGFLFRITSFQFLPNVCTCVVYAKRKNDKCLHETQQNIFLHLSDSKNVANNFWSF